MTDTLYMIFAFEMLFLRRLRRIYFGIWGDGIFTELRRLKFSFAQAFSLLRQSA